MTNGAMGLAFANDGPSSGIIGLWYTEDKDAIIAFYPCDNKICGRFHWLQDDSAEKPSLDKNNPDPNLQQRRLCGLEFMTGFKLTKADHYEHGLIYSPRHGENFDAQITLLDANRLKLRGFVLTSLFGSSQIWTKAPADAAGCNTY